MHSAAARTAAVRVLSRLSLPALAALAALFGGCVTTPPLAATRNQIIISVRDQKLTLVKDDHTRESFPISTSKFGLGDRRGTYATPTGELAVAAKIGAGKPAGTVFRGRVSTGEVVKVDAPGRDAIVSRIIALKGLEKSNEQAFSRGIYIHGTPEERNIGRPTSYGCIRMRSRDVITLFDAVKLGARVQIIDSTQNEAIASNILTPPSNAPAGSSPSTALAAAEAADTAKPPTVNIPANATEVKTSTVSPKPPPAAATAAPIPAPSPSPSGKKVWAGTPAQLLAKQADAEAKARKQAKPPVGAPASARPVSNTNDSDATRLMNRPSLDSM